MRAPWNGRFRAESDDTVVVEVNHYFPAEDLVVDGQVSAGVAWYRPAPTQAAADLGDHVAFWQGLWGERAGSDVATSVGQRLRSSVSC